MKQENIARYKEKLSVTVTITATPSGPDLAIVGSLDGSAKNFKSRTISTNGVVKFKFEMSGRHRVRFQPLFQLVDDPQASVKFEVSCDHGDSYDGGSKKKSDSSSTKGFSFTLQA
jgi:hypothetical protein